MKIGRINELCIEVTRRCNMSCAHCLRGDAQNADMPKAIINKFVEGLEERAYINNIVFTGGEPALNVPIMRYVREKFAEKGMEVGSFYVVTNGKADPMPLMQEALLWYGFVQEQDKDINGLALSSDPFHEEIPYAHLALLRGLSFFHEDDKKMWPEQALLEEGRAKQLAGAYQMYPVSEEHVEGRIDDEVLNPDSLNVDEGLLYLNVRGALVAGCNWSYNSQRDHTLAKVTSENWVSELAGKIIPHEESEVA